jgi:amino acid transporter
LQAVEEVEKKFSDNQENL